MSRRSITPARAPSQRRSSSPTPSRAARGWTAGTRPKRRRPCCSRITLQDGHRATPRPRRGCSQHRSAPPFSCKTPRPRSRRQLDHRRWSLFPPLLPSRLNLPDITLPASDSRRCRQWSSSPMTGCRDCRSRQGCRYQRVRSRSRVRMGSHGGIGLEWCDGRCVILFDRFFFRSNSFSVGYSALLYDNLYDNRNAQCDPVISIKPDARAYRSQREFSATGIKRRRSRVQMLQKPRLLHIRPVTA